MKKLINGFAVLAGLTFATMLAPTAAQAQTASPKCCCTSCQCKTCKCGENCKDCCANGKCNNKCCDSAAKSGKSCSGGICKK